MRMLKQIKNISITNILLLLTSITFQLAFTNCSQEKNKDSKTPISIELVDRDRFATLTNSEHFGNRIGYRFFEHIPIVFGETPNTIEETNIDNEKQEQLIEKFKNQNNLFTHTFKTKETEQKAHWIDLKWTFLMNPVVDGIDILLVIETADIGIPAYYAAQQCFRMSGKTNVEWRRKIAETPAFSEYDHWASQNENEKTSLTWIRRNNEWENLPSISECVGARTPSGVVFDNARFQGDLSQTIGPYKGLSQKSIDHGLATRVNMEATWISGLFWERTSHITDHHPADCLHAIVNIGNIPPHSKRVIRGKIYWFEGTKDDLFNKWQNDFYNIAHLNNMPSPPLVFRDDNGFVSMSPVLSQSEIYYTINGEEPTRKSFKYTDPFKQLSSATIKSKSIIDENGSSSKITKFAQVKVAKAEIWPKDAFIFKSGKITLSSNTSNSQLRYTLDGSEPDKTSQLYSTPFKLTETRTLRVMAFKNGFLPSEISSSKYERVKIGDELEYRYYIGTWESTPNFIELSPNKTGNVSKFSLDEINTNKDHYALLFLAKLKIKVAGEYILYCGSNDGSKLYIDNTLLIDNDGGHVYQENYGKINLDEGEHKIEVRYFQQGGGQELKVSWQGPGFEKREITKEGLAGNKE